MNLPLDYSRFFELTVDLLWISDVDGKILKVSPSIYKTLGYTEQEVIGRNYTDFMHPKDIEWTVKTGPSQMQEFGFVDDLKSRYICKNGDIKHFAWQAWQDNDTYWVLGRDITAQVQLQQQRDQEREVLERITKDLPAMVYQFEMQPNGEMKFTFASDGAEKFFELGKEIVGKRFQDVHMVFHPTEQARLFSLIKESAKTLTDFHWIGLSRSPITGLDKYLEARSSPTKHTDGSITWNGVLIDVHERVSAEKALEASRAETVHASKLSGIGEMAAGIAHEINNPLAIILGYADRLYRFAESSRLTKEEQIRLSSKIMKATERIEKIVSSMTNLAKRKSRDQDDVLVMDLIQDPLNISNEKFQSCGIQMRIIAANPLIKAKCVPHEVSQVILNLLNNSFEAIISLETKWIEIEVIEAGHEFVRIRISDSGNGLSKSVREKLWSPFVTTKPPEKGSGLGLSISKRLIERNYGKIFYDEKVPNTTFIIEIPAAV